MEVGTDNQVALLINLTTGSCRWHGHGRTKKNGEAGRIGNNVLLVLIYQLFINLMCGCATYVFG